jgi:hypothetical protein
LHGGDLLLAASRSDERKCISIDDDDDFAIFSRFYFFLILNLFLLLTFTMEWPMDGRAGRFSFSYLGVCVSVVGVLSWAEVSVISCPPVCGAVWVATTGWTRLTDSSAPLRTHRDTRVL